MILKFRRLDDDFQDSVITEISDLFDFVVDEIPKSILDPTEIDYHIDLRRAAFECILRLEQLRAGRFVSVGKTDHRAYRQRAVDKVDGFIDIGCRDTATCTSELHPLGQKLFNFIECGGRAEQRMVRRNENSFYIGLVHLYYPL